MGGKLGLSNGLDTGFGVATLTAGVAVDSGICVIVAVPTVSLLPSSVPLHGDQGGGMSVPRVSVSAADAASRASCARLRALPNGLAQRRLTWLGSSDPCERSEGESREHPQIKG